MSDPTTTTGGSADPSQAAVSASLPAKDASIKPVSGTGDGGKVRQVAVAGAFLFVAGAFVIIIASVFWPYFFVTSTSLHKTCWRSLPIPRRRAA
ncbi:MAG: hypothetical protein ACR2KT_14950 [Methylocella sp.]|nr:MAG: hypothetical protein DLM68_13255 [Hyphomicrobiales bacterium]